MTNGTCPMTACELGAVIIGARDQDGKLVNYSQVVEVDEVFLEAAFPMGAPETYMRFAGPCVGEACASWRGGRCQAIQRALAMFAAPDAPNDGVNKQQPLQSCVVRENCRWHREHGAQACAACAWTMPTQEAVAAE